MTQASEKQTIDQKDIPMNNRDLVTEEMDATAENITEKTDELTSNTNLNMDNDDDDSEESFVDDMDVNLEPNPVQETPKFKSQYSYTPGSNKIVRAGLERESPAVTPGNDKPPEDEEESYDQSDSYGFDEGNKPNAWQSPLLSKPASTTHVGEIDSDQKVIDEAQIQLDSLEAFARAAPSFNGYMAIPLDGDTVVDVRQIPQELLNRVQLPPAGRHTRTAFDLNLDGLDSKPWRRSSATSSSSQTPSRTAVMDSHFNFGFDEATWVVYARRQRETRLALSKYALDDGALNLEALAKQRRGFGGGFGFVLPGESTINESTLGVVAARLARDMRRCNIESMSAKETMKMLKSLAESHDKSSATVSSTISSLFIASNKWVGMKEGRYFGNGEFGLGYYKDFLPECKKQLRAQAEKLIASPQHNVARSSLAAVVVRGASLQVQYDQAAKVEAAPALAPQRQTTLEPLPMKFDPTEVSSAALVSTDQMIDPMYSMVSSSNDGQISTQPLIALSPGDRPPLPPGPPPLPPGCPPKLEGDIDTSIPGSYLTTPEAGGPPVLMGAELVPPGSYGYDQQRYEGRGGYDGYNGKYGPEGGWNNDWGFKDGQSAEGGYYDGKGGDRGRSDWGGDERGKGDRGKGERGKGGRGKGDRGKGDRGKGERGPPIDIPCKFGSRCNNEHCRFRHDGDRRPNTDRVDSGRGGDRNRPTRESRDDQRKRDRSRSRDRDSSYKQRKRDSGRSQEKDEDEDDEAARSRREKRRQDRQTKSGWDARPDINADVTSKNDDKKKKSTESDDDILSIDGLDFDDDDDNDVVDDRNKPASSRQESKGVKKYDARTRNYGEKLSREEPQSARTSDRAVSDSQLRDARRNGGDRRNRDRDDGDRRNRDRDDGDGRNRDRDDGDRRNRDRDDGDRRNRDRDDGDRRNRGRDDGDRRNRDRDDGDRRNRDRDGGDRRNRDRDDGDRRNNDRNGGDGRNKGRDVEDRRNRDRDAEDWREQQRDSSCRESSAGTKRPRETENHRGPSLASSSTSSLGASSPPKKGIDDRGSSNHKQQSRDTEENPHSQMQRPRISDRLGPPTAAKKADTEKRAAIKQRMGSR